MTVYTIRGCLVCGGDVTGNKEIGFLCGECHLVYERSQLPSKKSREELLKEFEEYVKSEHSDTYHVPDCKYARRISDPVTVSGEQLHALEPCKCVTHK